TSQFGVAPSQMVTPPQVQNHVPNVAVHNDFPVRTFLNSALLSPDQLRLRVSWALMQFIPVSTWPYGNAEYFNMLQRNAFGNFATFLREMTLHPAMGQYQDNARNRPKTASCPGCSTNENFAR